MLPLCPGLVLVQLPRLQDGYFIQPGPMQPPPPEM